MRPIAPILNNSCILTAAVKDEIYTHAKKNWAKAWQKKSHSWSTYQVTKKLTKDVLKKFKNMICLRSAVIVQGCMRKISLKNYFYKIKAKLLLIYLYKYRRKTVHYTLLEYFGFNKLREEMWLDKYETNLTKLLGDPILALKVSKFFLATSKLMQFRHLNLVAKSIDDTYNKEAALVKTN